MEFDTIDRFFGLRAGQQVSSRIPLGIGDDCAAIRQVAGQVCLTSVDTLVEGTHFFPDADALALGHKSLAVNLSDLAASGGVPVACLLAMSMPQIWEATRHGCSREQWLAGFSTGFLALANTSSCPLIGGDTTSVPGAGPVVVTVTVFGDSPANTDGTLQVMPRNGAVPGDDIWVSGELGGAGYTLHALFKQKGLPSCLEGIDAPQPTPEVSDRLHRPQPRLALGQSLRSLAHSALDISDGLAGDLGHILKASQLGATLWFDAIPRHSLIHPLPLSVQKQLTLCAGDDYELCFTAPVRSRQAIEQRASVLGQTVTRIGKTTSEPGLWLADSANSQDKQLFQPKAYEHFSILD